MSVIRPAGLLVWLICALQMACTFEPGRNRYQIEDRAAAATPVDNLQQRARSALAQGNYQLAIDILERAIRIEPRAAWSWHYLGESYWRRGDLQRCLSMVERAFSYADRDDQLLQRNRALKQWCSHG